jgi:type II pantothenate kinase
MKTLAIDFGASSVDAVLFDGEKILLKQSITKSNYSPKFLKQFPSPDRIITTGGKPRKDFPYKNEFDSLGQGGLSLTSLNSAVIVSCGTGTAIVSAEKNQPSTHLGGTGIGGGTLQGLGQLILNTSSPQAIFNLAKAGNRTQVDLTVGDILGQGIGLLPPEATAANFAKLTSRKKADLAQSLVNMVAETIGVTACLAAQKTQEKNLVFVGRVAANKLIQNYLQQVCQLFKLSPLFPQDGIYATALGAAILQSQN